MDAILQFAGDFWWLVFPLGPAVGGAVTGFVKGVRKWDERRRRDKIELARIKYGARAEEAERARVTRGEIDRTLARHDAVNSRWLDYELDIAKLIDYPLMTDMREPLTVDFHRARRDADAARPEDPAELEDPHRLAEYRDAVRRFETAFSVAEQEARRRRASGFSVAEQQALVRAKRLIALADDPGATYAERQSAYRRATKELQGLVVLPDATTESFEQRIAGAIGAPGRTADAGTAETP
ncbi:hypothetical protein MF406_03005 [Georgenia sp. TF02-10]|uniref:hypothetical protein n=1 Tax=Georgenia sp. TF02-10 TaxID=2917725 RepID=UPI001FA6C06F|nr:hypothetical protein [Georgenia sp. TF02-10]UNX55260.1 hypothetical protein MF406_03005 [Georgenia sp. TF02-10]